MNDNNYLMINGKRIDLTEEQIRQLIEPQVHCNPFERVLSGRQYYYLTRYGDVGVLTENNDWLDDRISDAADYFNDKEFATQVALHQLLYRKLLKFAYDNECEDTTKWDCCNVHYHIHYNCEDEAFSVDYDTVFKFGGVAYFSSEEGASRAIKEIVEPFMKEHPEFVW